MDKRPSELPAPDLPGPERPLAEIPEASSYRRGDQVWVYRNNQWHPGTVEAATEIAVLLSYRPGGGRGVSTDTVTAAHVAVRVPTATPSPPSF